MTENRRPDMPIPRRMIPWCLVAILAGCHPVPTPASATRTPAQTPTQTPTADTGSRVVRHVPWVVIIVVDQLAAWIADERWPLLPQEGGFARLRREGLTVRELRFAHAITDTAPGHGALFTGASPHGSGIVANDVISRAGKKISILNDATTRLVPVGGRPMVDRAGSSLSILRVDTLADMLMAARPDARVFSFSLKDRGALFGGGRHPELVLWLDTEGGTFVTSTAFATSTPTWIASLGDANALAQARAALWQPLDRSWLAAHAETADDQVGEGDYLGLGATFPHRATAVKAWRATPAADRSLFELALAAATQAASTRDGRSVLLSLSLSSHDYIAHVFGPNSWEAWDELRRLDAELATFFHALDRLVGPEGYAVMLTGDHGSNPLPELTATGKGRWCADPRGNKVAKGSDHWGRPCDEGRRLAPSELAALLEAEAHAMFDGPSGGGQGSVPQDKGGPRWIAGIAEPLVYLTDEGRALSSPRRAAFLARIKVLLGEKYSVRDVIDVRLAPASCPPENDQSLLALTCRSLCVGSPGDFYLVTAPGTFFDPELARGKGTSHGSAYLYDRAVPLLVRAPGRVPAGKVEDAPVSFTAFVRTAAALLGIPCPPALSEAPDLTAGAVQPLRAL